MPKYQWLLVFLLVAMAVCADEEGEEEEDDDPSCCSYFTSENNAYNWNFTKKMNLIAANWGIAGTWLTINYSLCLFFCLYNIFLAWALTQWDYCNARRRWLMLGWEEPLNFRVPRRERETGDVASIRKYNADQKKIKAYLKTHREEDEEFNKGSRFFG